MKRELRSRGRLRGPRSGPRRAPRFVHGTNSNVKGQIDDDDKRVVSRFHLFFPSRKRKYTRIPIRFSMSVCVRIARIDRNPMQPRSRSSLYRLIDVDYLLKTLTFGTAGFELIIFSGKRLSKDLFDPGGSFFLGILSDTLFPGILATREIFQRKEPI